MRRHESGGYHIPNRHVSLYDNKEISHSRASEIFLELMKDEITKEVTEVASEQRWRAKSNTHRASYDPVSHMFQCTCWNMMDMKPLWCSHIQKYFTEGEVNKDMAKYMRRGGDSLTVVLPVAGGWTKVLGQGTVFTMDKLNGNLMDQRLGLAIVFPELDGIEVWLEHEESLHKAIRVVDDWLDAMPRVEQLSQLNDFDTIECNSIRHGRNYRALLAMRDVARRANSFRNFIKAQVFSLHRYGKCTICATPTNIEKDIPEL